MIHNNTDNNNIYCSPQIAYIIYCFCKYSAYISCISIYIYNWPPFNRRIINAGVQIVHPFEEYPFADWRKMMAIHADGAFLVSRAAYRRMKASGKGGRIVFTGSVQSFVGSKLKEPYNFAKHGVAGLAKAIAREGAEYGIYTYTICPSFIKTPLVEKQIPEQAASLGITEEEVVKNIMLRDTVDGVFTTVEDVANTLVFLPKDQGALTGQSLRLTHGWAMM